MRLARFARVRLLRHALPISLLILRKKAIVLQSNEYLVWLSVCVTVLKGESSWVVVKITIMKRNLNRIYTSRASNDQLSTENVKQI